MTPRIAPWLTTTLASLLASVLAAQAAPRPYSIAPALTDCHAIDRLQLRPLVDSAAAGGPEVEVSELTLPPGWDASGPGHRHGRVEVLYILAGRLGHVVNDTVAELVPGQVGIVRPGDRVRHHVLSTEPVKALVIWAPGGELSRVTGGTRPC